MNWEMMKNAAIENINKTKEELNNPKRRKSLDARRNATIEALIEQIAQIEKIQAAA